VDELIFFSQDFLPYVDNVLRISLNRHPVDMPSLTKLIKVSASLPAKAQDSAPNTIDIINVLFEILLDGLRMKTKMLPLTIKSLIQVHLFLASFFCKPYSQIAGPLVNGGLLVFSAVTASRASLPGRLRRRVHILAKSRLE